MRTKIEVSSVSPRQSKSGRQYWVVNSDQGTLYVWDRNIANSLKPGRQYNVRIEQGDYPRIVDLSEPGAPVEASASPTGGFSSRARGDARRRSEAAPSRLELSQYSLEKAAQLLSNRQDADINLLLGYAERIWRWMLEKAGERVDVPPQQPSDDVDETDIPF
jgi:hypothetical protein